jgi:hypothetical protein
MIFVLTLVYYIWFGKGAQQDGKRWLFRTGFYSIILGIAFLAAFITFSIQAGIVAIGIPSTSSIPGDYLQLGINGWMILALGVLGILSPGIAAWLADN